MVRKDQTEIPGSMLSHRPGMTADKSPKDMAPRVRRGAIALLLEGQEENGKSELHGDAAIDGRLGTGMVAHAGRDVAGRAVLVVETELVLPVAIGHPDVDKVSVFRAPHRLPGVEGQADRLGVELDGGVDVGDR